MNFDIFTIDFDILYDIIIVYQKAIASKYYICIGGGIMAKRMPLYEKVMENLKEKIRSGNFTYDAPFTTEDRITKEYNVSRITAIRALDELEKQGIIYRKRGSGSFVAKAGFEILNNESDKIAEKPVCIRKSKEAALIALVLPFDIKSGGMLNCFEGINDLLNKGNCFIRIYNTNRKAEEEAEVLKSLLEHNIDGVICYPEKDNKNLEIYHQFLVKQIPLVLIDKHIENMPISYVVPDNYNGAKQLCDYAIETGHTRIGFLSISDFTGVSSLRERYMGYAASTNEHGMEVDLDNVIIGGNDFEAKGKGAGDAVYIDYLKDAIRRMRADGVTAVMCQNDWVARDVINCCDSMGISVPDDFLVMGFDHINAFQRIDVGERITTVEQDFYEIGRKAGEVILKEMDDNVGRCVRVVVPMKLVKAESSLNRANQV